MGVGVARVPEVRGVLLEVVGVLLGVLLGVLEVGRVEVEVEGTGAIVSEASTGGAGRGSAFTEESGTSANGVTRSVCASSTSTTPTAGSGTSTSTTEGMS